MKRNVTTQYFLYTIINGVKFPYFSSPDKKGVEKFYEEYCESFPESQFEILRQTTIVESEVIATSDDPRQFKFNF
jgi:hypothetical protein